MKGNRKQTVGDRHSETTTHREGGYKCRSSGHQEYRVGACRSLCSISVWSAGCDGIGFHTSHGGQASLCAVAETGFKARRNDNRLILPGCVENSGRDDAEIEHL